MSNPSPSLDEQNLQQEHQQSPEGPETSHVQSPNSNSTPGDRPRNQTVLTPHSETPTSVETPVPQSGPSPDRPLRIQTQMSEDLEVEDLESEGMPISPIPPVSATGSPLGAAYRRGQKRKKVSQKDRRKMQVAMKKLQSLNKNLNPIPFVPSKILDFPKHEQLLKRLGLWEFSRIEFDKTLRADIIAVLIASYSSKDRGGYIHGCKIPVNRADLGRALRLNTKKSMDCDAEKWPEDFVSFVDEFVSTWMLLHEDTWMMPEEVLAWTTLIKEGRLEKVDWAGLIWYMAEKELAKGPNLVNCYYASHLQHLIKVHKEEFLREEPMEMYDAGIVLVDQDADVKIFHADEVSEQGAEVVDQKMTVEPGAGVNVSVTLGLGQDDVSDTAAVSDTEVANSAVHISDNVKAIYNMQTECNADGAHVDNAENADNSESADADADDNVKTVSTALDVNNFTTAHDAKNVDDSIDDNQKADEDNDMMSFEICPGDEQGQWLLGGKSSIGEHFLRPCNMAEVKIRDQRMAQDGEGQDLDIAEPVDREQAGGCDGMQECNALERITPANLMQAMEAAQMPYTSSNLCDPSSLQLLTTRYETNMMMVGPSIFGDAANRDVGHISHTDLGDNLKKVSVDAPWDSKPADLDMCMDKLLQWAGRAKIAYEASREEACQHADLQQYYVKELENKDRIIGQLRTGIEELQSRRQTELSRLENELYIMSGLIDGYRRALKDTQGTFSEYRKRFPQDDEPIYRDAGGGGVVKSVMELEKERQRREKEERTLRSMVEEFAQHAEKKWESDMESYYAQLQRQLYALENLDEELGELRNSNARRKASATVHDE